MPLDWNSLHGFALATSAALRSARLSPRPQHHEVIRLGDEVLHLGLGALSPGLQAAATLATAAGGQARMEACADLEAELVTVVRTSLSKRPWILEIGDGPSGRLGLMAGGFLMRREGGLSAVLDALKDPALAAVVLDAGALGEHLEAMAVVVGSHIVGAETPLVVRNVPDDVTRRRAQMLMLDGVEPVGTVGMGGAILEDAMQERQGLWGAVARDERGLTVAGLEDLGDAMLALERSARGRCSAQLLYIDAEQAARDLDISGAYPLVPGDSELPTHRWLWVELADGLVALVPPRFEPPHGDWFQNIECLVLPGRRTFEVRGAGIADLRQGEGFGRAIRRARHASAMGSVSSGAWVIGSWPPAAG